MTGSRPKQPSPSSPPSRPSSASMPILAWPTSIRFYLASFLIVGLSLTVLGPALSQLRERSGSGLGDIGGLFVAQSLGYIAGSFVGGWLLDRVDGHRIMSGALIAMAVGLAGVPGLDSLLGLMTTFLVLGTGAAVADLAANTLLMWELGSAGGRAMNLLHLCFGLGALCAPLLVHLGLKLATLLPALVCLVLAGWACTVRAPARPAAARAEHTTTTLPLLMLLCGFFAVYVGLEVGFAGWIHTYGEEIEFGALAATWLTTTFWIGFTVGRLVASALAVRVSPTSMLTWSCAATVAAATLLLLSSEGDVPVFVATALMGLATAPQFPGMMNFAEARLHVTGSATMWFVGGAGIGGLVFPFLIGRWFDAAGATALPWATTVFAVVTLAVYGVVYRALGGRRAHVGA